MKYSFVLLIIFTLSWANIASCKSNQTKNAIGISVGAPQTIALVYNRVIYPNWSFQAHAGSVVIFSSAGARLQWLKRPKGFSPYLFLGATLINSRAEDYGDPKGITRYLWFGPGLRYSRQHWLLYIEVCGLQGGNDNKGIGADWLFPFDPAIAGGFLIKF